jgi:hypothetical protein
MTHPSQACHDALAAIEADPLALPPEAEAHVARCPTCSEARVAWLAMEDIPSAQAPAGYFDHLPGRVLRKLPTRAKGIRRYPALWALAAGLLMAVGAGGFWLGRANRQPLVEATLAPAPQELPTTLPETPFLEADDPVDQLHKLTPEEAKALMDNLEPKPAKESKP